MMYHPWVPPGIAKLRVVGGAENISNQRRADTRKEELCEKSREVLDSEAKQKAYQTCSGREEKTSKKAHQR